MALASYKIKMGKKEEKSMGSIIKVNKGNYNQLLNVETTNFVKNEL